MSYLINTKNEPLHESLTRANREICKVIRKHYPDWIFPVALGNDIHIYLMDSIYDGWLDVDRATRHIAGLMERHVGWCSYAFVDDVEDALWNTYQNPEIEIHIKD